VPRALDRILGGFVGILELLAGTRKKFTTSPSRSL
jgi:hypothetical protein